MIRRLSTLVLALALLAPLAAHAQPTTFLVLDGPQVALPSAARTETTSSGWFRNDGAGVLIAVDTTAIDLTPSHTISVELWDPGTGAAEPITTAGIWSATAVGRQTLAIGNTGTTANCGQTACLLMPLPLGLFRVTMTAGDTDSITYSVTLWPLR